jgi:hypothetical protein
VCAKVPGDNLAEYGVMFLPGRNAGSFCRHFGRQIRSQGPCRARGFFCERFAPLKGASLPTYLPTLRPPAPSTRPIGSRVLETAAGLPTYPTPASSEHTANRVTCAGDGDGPTSAGAGSYEPRRSGGPTSPAGAGL